MFYKYLYNLLLCCLLLMQSAVLNAAQSNNQEDIYSLKRFIDESLKLHSGLVLADLKVKRLAFDLDKAASQLGWVLTAQGGYQRNSSSFGIQADVVDFSVGMERLLKSGHTLSLSGRHEYNDSQQVLSTLSANPEDKTKFDINYRIPLKKGENNIGYSSAITKAEIEAKMAEFEKVKVRDNLIKNLIEIYYSLATLDARLVTAEKSLDRTKKLRRYIKSNINLGLLEKGEILQIDSQVFSLKLEKQKILDLKRQQILAVNRFLEKKPNNQFITSISNNESSIQIINTDTILKNVEQNSIDLALNKLKSDLLNSMLLSSKDREKSKLDLVMSLGVQNRSGNSSSGVIDDTDTVGMIRFEYRNALDKRTFSSERLQIQIDRESNKEERLSLMEDLKYESYQLIEKVKKSENIVNISKLKDLNEVKKYKDILNRFKQGRSTTNTLIQFDNERIRAELDYDTERYELFKRADLLNLKQGLFYSSLLNQERGFSAK